MKSSKTGAKKPAPPYKRIAVDLARFDIANWLERNRNLAPTKNSSPVQELLDDGAKSALSHSTAPESSSAPSPARQVEALGEFVAIPTWFAVEAVADTLADASTQKKKLARHVWCAFFVGLARAVEDAQGALDDVKKDLKSIVRSTILSSRTEKGLSAKLVDAVVDKGWEYFISALTEQEPRLGLITKPDLLRSLRIMAVFCCPAPEKHREVQRHALRPLEKDVEDMFKDEARARLEEALPQWQGQAWAQ